MEAAHIARRRSEPAFQIARVDGDSGKLVLDWEDGHQSIFHTIWLRDNCSCQRCGDHSGGHRFFELNMLPPSLDNTAGLEDGLIRIEWLEDGHVSLFDPSWLRSHCYSDRERAKRKHRPVLWDAGLSAELPRINYQHAMEDQAALLSVFDYVKSHGICLLQDVPKAADGTEEIASLLGYVRETHYGRVFEIISTPNPKVLANAPVSLRPHTDENFREPPPGIMVFHSIKASEDGGGESVMTDGFRLAADFKSLHPDSYELLSRVPIPHRRFIEDVGLRAEAPVIGLDYAGDIREFRLNERTMAPIDLPEALVEPVYQALSQIFSLSYDSRYHMKYLLKDGEALVFDNARVLHARTAFNGNRHVRLTHVGRDEFYSRWRQLRHQQRGDINLQ